MAGDKLFDVIIILLGLSNLCLCMPNPINSQNNVPACPEIKGYIYVPHELPCYFYACYEGSLVSETPYKCPTNPAYYELLQSSGYMNPCSYCPQAPVESTTSDPATSSSSTVASITTTTTTTSVPPSDPSVSTSTAPSGEPMTTTTAATTTSKFSSTLKEISLIRINAHVQGAVWAGSNTTLRQCLSLCEETLYCFGFDFDKGSKYCWMHKGTNVCADPEPKDNCTHFRLFDQCPEASTPPTGSTTLGMTTLSPTDSTDAPFIESFTGQHIRGGTLIPLSNGMATADNCVATCRSDSQCYGADFDMKSGSCWIHGLDSVCNPMIIKPTCSHYRLQDVCDMESTTSMSPVGTGSMTATPPGSTTMLPVSTTDGGDDSVTPSPALDVLPNGYFEFVEGHHVPGGMMMFAGISLRQCLDACLVTPYCLALDYGALDQTCYFHFQDTFCSQPMELPGNYHFKRIPCLDGVVNDAAATWYHFHVQLGSEICVGCTLGYCMDVCYTDPDCAGIDFDIRNLGCYMFNRDNVCGPLVPKDYCIHISRDVCVPDVLSGIPIHNLALLVYPPPSALPSGWLAYPGFMVRNGIRVGGYDMTGDDCVSICEQDSLCNSGDYNTADGSCWLHIGSNRQCGQVEVSDTVYHFKKETCDVVFGTMQLYVSATWVSP